MKRRRALDGTIELLDRIDAITALAAALDTFEHWALVAPPAIADKLVRAIPEHLRNQATYYADSAGPHVLRCNPHPASAPFLCHALIPLHHPALIVTLPKSDVPREALERMFGHAFPGMGDGNHLQDVILLRDNPHTVTWPTLLIDAVMLADPAMGTAIVDTCRNHPGGEQ